MQLMRIEELVGVKNNNFIKSELKVSFKIKKKAKSISVEFKVTKHRRIL